mgnify:CR=1 FL=1
MDAQVNLAKSKAVMIEDNAGSTESNETNNTADFLVLSTILLSSY